MDKQPAPRSDQHAYAIGIDVGGTKIAGGLVELATGALLARRQSPTNPARGGAAVLGDTLALATALQTEASALGVSVFGIGIGVAELVDRQGRITSAHTIPWRGVAVGQQLAQIAPTVIESDVRAHALAEARYGAGRTLGQFVFVTVGTGISSCLVLDGRPHAGAHGNALVLASSPLTTTCSVCNSTMQPILEDYASGPALVVRYNQLAHTYLRRAEAVLAAVDAGDQLAEQIVRSAGAALGVSIGWLVNVLDPEGVIIGGGLGLAGGLYWDSMVDTARAHIWADTSRDLPIIHAALGADAGVIGAACYALDRAL